MPRIIYALLFEMSHPKRSERYELTVPLTPDGQSKCCRADTKPRVIDLRKGDFLIHKGTRYLIKDVKADTEGTIDAGRSPTDGYVVRGS